jgi:hypothetical protein
MSMNVPNDSTRNRCETCGSGGYRKATRACRAVGNARKGPTSVRMVTFAITGAHVSRRTTF